MGLRLTRKWGFSAIGIRLAGAQVKKSAATRALLREAAELRQSEAIDGHFET
jgi:hypothetical protein